jgi:hypothetical protein
VVQGQVASGYVLTIIGWEHVNAAADLTLHSYELEGIKLNDNEPTKSQVAQAERLFASDTFMSEIGAFRVDKGKLLVSDPLRFVDISTVQATNNAAGGITTAPKYNVDGDGTWFFRLRVSVVVPATALSLHPFTFACLRQSSNIIKRT